MIESNVQPLRKNKEIICIHERHKSLSTDKMFIKSLQSNIQKLRKTREFWKPIKTKKVKTQHRKGPQKRAYTHLSQKSSSNPFKIPVKTYTESEIFSLPKTEERTKLEIQFLKKHFLNHDHQVRKSNCKILECN